MNKMTQELMDEALAASGKLMEKAAGEIAELKNSKERFHVAWYSAERTINKLKKALFLYGCPNDEIKRLAGGEKDDKGEGE